jgi:hypothetical protein
VPAAALAHDRERRLTDVGPVFIQGRTNCAKGCRGTDEDALTWLGLCASEHDLRQKLNTCGDSKSPEFRETLRAWWGAIEALLEFHEREIARLGFARRNLPIQVLAALRGCAGYRAVGQIPGVVEGAATEGRRRVGPSERRDIGFAVSYHRAATGGIEHEDERIAIDDRSPVKTIMEAFGASRTTVQGCMSKIRPAFLGVNPINDEVLTTLMKEAGERYKNAGRSHGAILSRASLDDLERAAANLNRLGIPESGVF